MLQHLPEVSADLYRIAANTDASRFHDVVMESIKRFIHFDAGGWGKVAMVGKEVRPHEIKPYKYPKELFLELGKIADQDPTVPIVLESPGKAFAFAKGELPREARKLVSILDKYDICYGMATGAFLPKSGLLHIVVLHRDQRGRPFNEEECEFKEALMPHLVESQRQNHHLQIRRELLRSWEEKHCTATSDLRGVLSEAEDRFIDLLIAEWPGWNGARLPESLVERIASDREWHYHGKRMAVHGGPMDDFCLMIASRPGVLARLSRREQEAARLYAQGKTNKEIATQLFISPATARNHLAKVYSKLEVSNKTDLLKKLSEADGQLALLESGSSMPQQV